MLARGENVKVILYKGNAEDIVEPAVRLGWEYIEDDHIDADGVVDWDSVCNEATDYLNKLGYRIEYN